MKKTVAVLALALGCVAARAEEESTFDFIAESARARAGDVVRRQHRWGADDPVREPAFDNVQMLIFGRSKHVGMSPHLNDSNPGIGARVSIGPCFWGLLKCHLAVTFVDRNSVLGNTWTIGGGVKKEVIDLNPTLRLPVTGTIGVDAFLMQYQYLPRRKTYTAPAGVPFVEVAYQIDKDTSIGIGEFIVPAGKGKRGKKRIEIRYLTLEKKF